MARTTKQLSGGGKDKLLRGLVQTVSDLTSAQAKSVGDTLTRNITDVRVRRDVWENLAAAPTDLMPTPVGPRAAPAARAMPAPAPTPPAPADAPPPAATTILAQPFDPFAFSAVALLTRKGKPALAEALEKIETAAHLRQLAEAQHLAVEPALTDVVELRAAIIVGVERRIAERKAAAS